MQIYFAPMEGLTDSIFRSAHSKYFSGIDRYYIPFISPTVHRELTAREARDLPTADSIAYTAVPQILTKNAEDFLWAAQQCASRGYGEVNLNLGCPSGTVVSKGKGAGMLKDIEALDAFLDAVYENAPVPISVKTRLGLTDPEEFEALLEIFNRYPIAQLTVHSRVRADFYDRPIREEWFSFAVEHSKNPLCYNGNILSAKQAEDVAARYENLDAVMIGRGLIADPGMFTPGGTQREALRGYHDELLQSYMAAFGSARNTMFRMKEFWRYLHVRFEGSEKLWKRLRKTTDFTQFQQITREMLTSLPLVEGCQADW